VKRCRLKLCVALSCLTLLLGDQVAQAGAFDGFFPALKRLFSKPKHKMSTHRRAHKTSHETASREVSNDEMPDRDTHTPPSEANIRTATQANRTKGSKGDLRYAIPVPGKKGLVTSPFAPDSGFIDVRSFPPGTPVKDPYTGKTFLTP
jgi:hypothetical protein